MDFGETYTDVTSGKELSRKAWLDAEGIPSKKLRFLEGQWQLFSEGEWTLVTSQRGETAGNLTHADVTSKDWVVLN